MNFLGMINDVLVRLREPKIDVIGETPYSDMIGSFINDAKRRVESAHNWMALSSTASIITVPGTTEYTLDDAGTRFKVIGVYNGTALLDVEMMPVREITLNLRQPSPQRGSVQNYGFNGITASGRDGSVEQRADHDPLVTLYPIPTVAEIIYFDLYTTTDLLIKDTDLPLVPPHLLVDYAYAKAIAERGEDGGISTTEALAMWHSDLSDEIAIEAARFPDQLVWEAV